MRPHGAILAQSRHCTAANLHKPHNSQSVCLGALENCSPGSLLDRPRSRGAPCVCVCLCVLGTERGSMLHPCVSARFEAPWSWHELCPRHLASRFLRSVWAPVSWEHTSLHQWGLTKPPPTHTRAHTKTRLLEYRREPDLKSSFYLS